MQNISCIWHPPAGTGRSRRHGCDQAVLMQSDRCLSGSDSLNPKPSTIRAPGVIGNPRKRWKRSVPWLWPCHRRAAAAGLFLRSFVEVTFLIRGFGGDDQDLYGYSMVLQGFLFVGVSGLEGLNISFQVPYEGKHVHLLYTFSFMVL